MLSTSLFHKYFLWIFLLVAACSLPAQKASFDDFLEVRLQNIEPISSMGEVKGYCMFYYIDKAKEKNMANYKMVILDQDLNKISDKNIVDSKNIELKITSYNGKTLMLLFWDAEEYTLVFKQYDLQCNLLSSLPVETLSYESYFIDAPGASAHKTRSYIQPIEGKGYLFYSFFGLGGAKYKIRSISNEGKLLWTCQTTDEESQKSAPIFMAASDQVILHNMQNNTGDNVNIKAIDALTGKQLYDKEMKLGKYEAQIMNAFPDSTGTFTVCGQLFDPNDNSDYLFSAGLFNGTIDAKGKFITSHIFLWKDLLKGKIAIDEQGQIEGKGYPYLHTGVRLKDGKIYMIGECFDTFKKTGVALNDMVVAEFSKDMITGDIHFMPKKNEIPPAGGLSWFTNYRRVPSYIKSTYHGFDYIYHQKTDDSFTFFYNVDPDPKIKKDVNKRGTVSKRFDEAEYQTDQIAIKTEADKTYVLPAKPGHILFVEYTKKTKKMDMRLEKYNY